MSKLLEIVKGLVKAADQETAFDHAPHFHLRLEQEAYMPLVIEAWPNDQPYEGEKRVISVAHYFEQEGDLVADPEVLMTDKGNPIHLQQVLAFTQIMYHGKPPFATVIDENAKYNVLHFMDMWAQNIQDQGWLDVAAKQKGARD